jgi:hypothetical protein
MPQSPNVPQGTLNRIRASVTIPAFPSLNITASFLGKRGISVARNGPITTSLPTMTGAVQSPEPYQPVRITAALIKSQALAAAWQAQEQLNSLLGAVNVRPDATPLVPYPYTNCALENVDELQFNGESEGYIIHLTGYYLLNSSLWG